MEDEMRFNQINARQMIKFRMMIIIMYLTGKLCHLPEHKRINAKNNNFLSLFLYTSHPSDLNWKCVALMVRGLVQVCLYMHLKYSKQWRMKCESGSIKSLDSSKASTEIEGAKNRISRYNIKKGRNSSSYAICSNSNCYTHVAHTYI